MCSSQAEGRDAWFNPSMHISGSVACISFNGIDSQQLSSIARELAAYAQLCVLAAEMVPPMGQPLLRQVISQYYHALFRPFAVSSIRDPPIAICEHAQAIIGKLEGTVESSPRPEWVALTIFDISYATMAWKFGVGEQMEERARSDPQASSWLRTAAPFAPRAVAFDVGACKVGMSGIRWKAKLLRKWEQRLRSMSFAPEMVRHLGELESRIQARLDPQAPALQQIDAATAVVEQRAEDLCSLLCEGREWYCVEGESLEWKDQCGWCRVYFRKARFTNRRPPRYALNVNRGHACQCAEARLISQLFCIEAARLPLALASQGVADRLEGEVLPERGQTRKLCDRAST